MSDFLSTLQSRVMYAFKRHELLKMALTHASVNLNNQGSHEDLNYERLEFLGDRVVGLVVAELLYLRYPHEREGDLAKRHAALVQGKTLAMIARHIELGKAMILSNGERAAGGAENENMLADTLEALIGAVYLDGGLAPCQKLVSGLWEDYLDTMSQPPQDPKTALQEWAQGRGLPLPEYEVIGREGPDHAPLFTIQVSVSGFKAAQADGPSRRLAEKAAAEQLLINLQKIGK